MALSGVVHCLDSKSAPRVWVSEWIWYNSQANVIAPCEPTSTTPHNTWFRSSSYPKPCLHSIFLEIFVGEIAAYFRELATFHFACRSSLQAFWLLLFSFTLLKPFACCLPWVSLVLLFFHFSPLFWVTFCIPHLNHPNLTYFPNLANHSNLPNLSNLPNQDWASLSKLSNIKQIEHF